MVGVVNLVVLACVLRVVTKKGCNFFHGRKCTSPPRENPGYAYVVDFMFLDSNAGDEEFCYDRIDRST